MADNDTALPEGTDSVIAGASRVEGATADTDTVLLDDSDGSSGDANPTQAAAAASTAGGTATSGRTGTTSPATAPTGSSTSEGGIGERIRSGRDKLSNQAGDRARGLLGQGLERSSEALANVGRMIGDTASGIDDRLGNEYGDYARRAAGAIENAANTIASKDPDELIDDARGFVRNSPGIALAGAAVVGFVVARLVKSGLATSRGDDGDDRD